jgi:hypothetical protein
VGDKQHLKYLWGGVETNKESKKQVEESNNRREAVKRT